tara:strand:- start:33 stop:491 length:459 start_codon:yes stop_codon:yes gene_type:complete
MDKIELNKLNIGRIWKAMTASGEVIDTDDKKIKESQYNMKKRLNKPTNPTIISLMKTIIFLFNELSMYKNKNHDEVNHLEEENHRLKKRIEYLEFQLNEEKGKVERLKENNYKQSKAKDAQILHYRRQLGHDVDVNVNARCYDNDDSKVIYG